MNLKDIINKIVNDEDNLLLLFSLAPIFALGGIATVDALTRPQVKVVSVINKRLDLIPYSLTPILVENEQEILIPDMIFELAKKYGLTQSQILSYIYVRFAIESIAPPAALFFSSSSSTTTKIDIAQYARQDNKYIAYVDIPLSLLLTWTTT